MSHFARNSEGPDWWANGEHPLRDVPPCGCGTAPCGLVDSRLVNPDCKEHAVGRNFKQRHSAEDCKNLLRDELEGETNI